MATIQNDITLPVNAICHVEYRGTSSYVYQDPESPELTTNSKTDSLRWTLRVNIGEARRETPAAYVIYHGGFTDNRTIFCLNSASILQNYEFDLLDAKWKPGLLHSLKLPALPKTQIAALWDGNQLRVYYQGIDRVIKEALSDGLEGAWRIDATGAKTLQKAIPWKRGAPLAAFKGSGPLRIFYGREREIRQMTYDGKDWTDSEVPGSQIMDSRKPFSVSEDENGQPVLRTVEKTIGE